MSITPQLLTPCVSYLDLPLGRSAGPVLAMTWSYAVAGEAYRFEWPALWCAYSFFQCLFTATYEMAVGATDARVVGTGDNAKYRQLVKEGRLFDQRVVLPDDDGHKKRQ